jgi:hypothetical protein
MADRTIVQRVLREHFREHWAKHEQPERVLTAVNALLGCRTRWFGGRVQACPNGHVRKVEFNSCGHRACVLCAYTRVEQWAAKQLAMAPACAYSHVVFTLPSQLRALWRYNRQWLTDALFRLSWEALRQMLSDPRHLGALPGALAAFQSWNDTLGVHPHLHVLLTHGGISPQGQWRGSEKSRLLPPRALAALFRGKLRAALSTAIEAGELQLPPGKGPQQWLNLLNKLGRRKWRVQVQPPYEYASGVIKYLARYVRGGPIRAAHLLGYDGRRLRLRPKNHTERIVEFSAEEFLERFLTHIPVPRSHLIRAYGLFHSSKRERLDAIRAHFGQQPIAPQPAPAWQELCADAARFGGWHPECCPICGQRLVIVERLAHGRSPPLVKYAA